MWESGGKGDDRGYCLQEVSGHGLAREGQVGKASRLSFEGVEPIAGKLKPLPDDEVMSVAAEKLNCPGVAKNQCDCR